MRLGTFLFGTLCGAAATVYLSNKSKNSMFGGFMNAGNFMGTGKAFEKASKAVNNFTGTTSGTSTSSSNVSGTNKSGLDRVESIVNEDPALKRQVNEILADNAKSTTTEGIGITV